MRGKGRQSHAPPRNGRKLAPLLVTGTAEERGSETRRRRRFLFHFRVVGQWNDCDYFRQRDFHCLKLVHSVGPYREEPCVKHPAKHAASNAEWRCWRISLKSDAGTTGMFLIAGDCANLRALLANRSTAIKRLPYGCVPTSSLPCMRPPA